MRMDFGLNLVQEQKLIMTQQMQLSVKLLQMSSLEVLQYVEKELQENPVLVAQYDEEEKTAPKRVDYKEFMKYLEFDNYSHHSFEKDEDEISPFTFIADKRSLRVFLYEQLSEVGLDPEIREVCEHLVDNIDDRGYLETDINSAAGFLGKSSDTVEEALDIVQSLEPAGIAARDLKECLRLQLKRKGVEIPEVYNIIDKHLENLAESKYTLISKDLGISPKEAQDYGDIIRTLEPKPSRGFFTGDEVRYIIPDASVRKIDGEFFITLNESVIPKLSISKTYREILERNDDKEIVDYVKTKLNNAVFLIKSLDSRSTTIYRVLEKIVEFQREYFDHGEQFLKPMTLKMIADALELHESTVSRAVRDKYVYTSLGTIRLRDLFTTAITSRENGEDVSAKSIKNRIKELIFQEDKTRPLSDQDICDILNRENMNISRRTVAKYREEMGIKSSSKRKRF